MFIKTSKKASKNISIPILSLPQIGLYYLDLKIPNIDININGKGFDIYVYGNENQLCVVFPGMIYDNFRFQKYLVEGSIESFSDTFVLNQEDDLLADAYEVVNTHRYLREKALIRKDPQYFALSNNLKAAVFIPSFNLLYQDYMSIYELVFIDLDTLSKKIIPLYFLEKNRFPFKFLIRKYSCFIPYSLSVFLDGGRRLFLKGEYDKNTALIPMGTVYSECKASLYNEPEIKQIYLNLNLSTSQLQALLQECEKKLSLEQLQNRHLFNIFIEFLPNGTISCIYFVSHLLFMVMLAIFYTIRSIEELQELFNEVAENIYSTNNIKAEEKQKIFRILLKAIATIYASNYHKIYANDYYKRCVDVLITDDYFFFFRTEMLAYSSGSSYSLPSIQAVFDYNLNLMPFSDDFIKYKNTVLYGKRIISAFDNNLAFTPTFS